ncbi:MAG: nucleotidyltransferase substrate binding protein [bacterium]
MMSQNSIVNEIVSKANPSKIVLFGSCIREDERRDSDIDIALFGASSDDALLLKEGLKEKVWLDMLKERNLTSHIYEENEVGGRIYQNILEHYVGEFKNLRRCFKKRLDKIQDEF